MNCTEIIECVKVPMPAQPSFAKLPPSYSTSVRRDGESSERMQRVKTQKSQRLKMGKLCSCPGVHCVAVKNLNSSKSKRPLDC